MILAGREGAREADPARPRLRWLSSAALLGVEVLAVSLLVDLPTEGPSMPESNFRMAKESLIRNISIPPQNIHRMRGELKPQEAAHESEIEIRRFFGLKEGEFPRFSLILLGIGEDGVHHLEMV